MLAEAESCLTTAWQWDDARRLEVYTYTGGQHVGCLLHVMEDRAVLVVNSTLVHREGQRVATGWALALAEHGEPGWYALLRRRA